MTKRKLITLSLTAGALLLMAAELDTCGSRAIDRELGQTKFTDVSGDHNYYAGIRVAEAEGLIQGYPGNEFRPDQVITPDQMSRVVSRYYDQGMTRAEFSTFMSEGILALYKHSLEIELVKSTGTVFLTNKSSLPVNLGGWTITGSDANYNTVTYWSGNSNSEVAAYRTLTLELDSYRSDHPLGVNLKIYGISIASDS